MAAHEEAFMTIDLTLGQVTVIDAGDWPLVRAKKWQARPRRDGKGFYAVSSSGVRMHRLLLGVWDSRIVDHIDGDGLNNRRLNLRPGTQAQNCVNRKQTPGKYLRGTAPKKGKWRAFIKHNGVNRALGYFNTELDAHEAYLKAATGLHGEWVPDHLTQPLPKPPVMP